MMMLSFGMMLCGFLHAGCVCRFFSNGHVNLSYAIGVNTTVGVPAVEITATVMLLSKLLT